MISILCLPFNLFLMTLNAIFSSSKNKQRIACFPKRSSVIKEEKGAQRGRKPRVPSHIHSNLHSQGRQGVRRQIRLCSTCSMHFYVTCVHKKGSPAPQNQSEKEEDDKLQSTKLLMALLLLWWLPGKKVHELGLEINSSLLFYMPLGEM